MDPSMESHYRTCSLQGYQRRSESHLPITNAHPLERHPFNSFPPTTRVSQRKVRDTTRISRNQRKSQQPKCFFSKPGDTSDLERVKLFRNYLYREIMQFSKGVQGSYYDTFLSTTCPTDPLMLSTVPASLSSVNVDIANTKPPRPRWDGLVPLLFVLLCDSIQSGLMLTPALPATYGLGLSFYIICAIFWIVALIPVIQLQHVLSQFFQGGPLRTFTLMNSRLRGIGVAIFLLLCLRSPYQLRLIGHSILYLFGTTRQLLPWTAPAQVTHMCDIHWGSSSEALSSNHMPPCIDLFHNGSWVPDTLSSVSSYYTEKMLLSSLDAPQKFHAELAAASVIGICLVFALALMDLRFFGQVAMFVAIGLIILMGTTTFMALNEIGGFEGRFSLRDFASLTTWLQAALLSARASAIIAGHHCVMTSYTRVGTNALYLSWIVGFFSILVSIWITSLLHIFQGSYFVALLRTTLERIYEKTYGTSYPSLLPHVESGITHVLYSSLFQNFVLSGMSNHIPHDFVFVFYPWGAGTLKAGSFLVSVFFFLVTIAGAVALSGICIALAAVIQEVATFEAVHPFVIKTSVLTVLFLSTLPFFFSAPLSQNIYPSHGLSHMLYHIMEASIRFGVPFLGLCYIVGTLWAVGYDKQSIFVHKCVIAIHWVLTIAGLTLSAVLLDPPNEVYRLCVAGATAFCSVIGVPAILAIFGRRAYRDNFWALFLGDVEPLRALINTIMIGYNCHFRLRRLWSIALKYGSTMWFLLLVMTINPAFGFKLGELAVFDRYRIASYTIVILIVVTPVVVLATFPEIGESLDPSASNRWKITDIIERTGPKHGMKRVPLKFWEEYFLPDTLWTSVYTTTLGKL